VKLCLLIAEDDLTTPVENSKQRYDISSSLVKVLAISANTEHGETMKKIKAYYDFINKLVYCKFD
jgi:uncharacterized lipoprotein YajG